jgi:hypothetical protein
MTDTTEEVPANCSCWLLPLEDGGTIPAARLLHLTGVAVETARGPVYRGECLGTCWAGLPAKRERHLLVREESGECYAIPEKSVRRVGIEPGSLPSKEAETALTVLASTIRHTGISWDAVEVSSRLDHRTDLRATVWLVDHHCEPGPDPRPRETTPRATPTA